jgi:hypothetical protein
VRPSDYITVTPSELALLRSDDFKRVVPVEVAREMRLTSGPERSQRLSLPQVGAPVAEALRTLAAFARTPQAVIAEHLAERIAHRVALR